MLKFLQWKKWIIASIIMAIVWYLWAKQIIDSDTVLFIWTINTLLFWVASNQTKKLYK